MRDRTAEGAADRCQLEFRKCGTEEGKVPRGIGISKARFSGMAFKSSPTTAYQNDMEVDGNILQRLSSNGFQVLPKRINAGLQRNARIAIAPEIAKAREKRTSPVNIEKLFTTITLRYGDWPDACKILCMDIIVGHSRSIVCRRLMTVPDDHALYPICPNKAQPSNRRAYWRLWFGCSKRLGTGEYFVLRNRAG